jgi:hypothetical protein
VSATVLIAPKEEELRNGNHVRLRSSNGQCIFVRRDATLEALLKEGFLLWQEAPASGKPVLYRRPQ